MRWERTPIVLALTAALIIMGSGCLSGSDVEQNANPADSNRERTYAEEPEHEPIIMLPPNLRLCQPKYNEKSADAYVIDCDREQRNPVCAYYREKGNTTDRISKTEYKNECTACRYFGEDGMTVSRNVSYQYLGHQDGPCS